ncbi:DNA ligase [Streptomyces niveus]|uniref:ATP-dependent DNA ligase n=1 Tax=Streptomyces niveus TaxID=193462 RepID=UPI003665267B
MEVAEAQSVRVLPRGPGLRYEPKLDGHRTILWRGDDVVRLQAGRSGRDVTAVWADLAWAGMALEPGTVLDGEVVIMRDGVLDFGAVQARAASTPARARLLAEQLPAHYAVWDCLAHHGEDVRSRPYDERRALLLDVLAGQPPPIQPVLMTDDPEVALLWYSSLRTIGIEGLVIKRASGVYRKGRIWTKIRHAETVDAVVVGYTGAATRPRALAVRLPDGRITLSQRLTAPVTAAAALHLVASAHGPRARTPAGDAFTPADVDLVVEVLAGTTARHAVVTVTRVR